MTHRDTEISLTDYVKATEAAQTGVWVWDLKTGALYWNSMMFELYGLKETQFNVVEYNDWRKRCHPDDVKRIEENIQNALNDHALRFIDEFRVFDEHGKIKYLSAEATIEYNNEQPARMIGLNRDITKYKQIESELRDNAEKFHQTMFYGPIGKAIVDLEGKWIDTNPALCELLGYTKQQLLSMSLNDVIFPIDINIDHILSEEMLSGKTHSIQVEKRLVHQNGRAIWVQINTAVVRNINQEPQYFILQIQNIDNRKRQEEQLRESEQRYYLALRGSSDGIWDWRVKENICYRSPRLKQMLGYDENEIDKSFEDGLISIHDEDRTRFIASLNMSLQNRTPFICEY